MPTLRHRLELAGFLAARGLVRALPHRAARPLGAAVGGLAALVDRSHYRIARDNLAIAFPEWDERRCRAVARACFRHFGAALCDALSFGRFDPVGVCRHFTLVGWEHLDAAAAHGRGVVTVTAHLGSWEIAAHPMGLYRAPFHSVARPFPNPLVWERVVAERERLGLRLIAKQGAAKPLLRALRAGETVTLIMDQRVRPSQGIELPFFGRPALTTPLGAQLALRQGAPVVPFFCFPAPSGAYRLEIQPPILPEEMAGMDEEARVAALTARILAVFEEVIRAHPEQWLWMHRRWRLE